MILKSFLSKLNIFAECKNYKVPLWQCPSFLFVIMGLVIIAAMLTTYYIGINYVSPEILIIILSVVTVILLVVGHSIVASFERIAQANRMKSEFVSIVSHQLRTPLSSLKWSLDLLRGRRLGEITEKQEEYLDIINESNNRMIDLVNDLLNVNRIEQGRLEVKPEPFLPGPLLKDIIGELKPLATEKKVVIKFKEQKNIPKVYADSTKVRMVAQNLIDNAIKYSRKEGGVAEVAVELIKDKVKIIVKDDGVGIPKARQSQVFGKFFRGDDLIKQRVEGAGLGLFIAKGIVELSGGEMNFKSREGDGSTFWFTLPTTKNKK